MELIHLIRFILSLDNYWLRPLRTRVPDYQQILQAPRERLQRAEIEIGPWTRYVRGYVIPLLLFFPLLGLSEAFDYLPATVGLALAWLVGSHFLVSANRGGRCIIRADGVEFIYRGVAVVCPWDLFHVAGQAVYHPEMRRLDLPVNPAALARIEFWKNDNPLEEGKESQVSHFTFLPNGEVRLLWVYRVIPAELGAFLLAIGGTLGRPALEEDTPEPAPTDRFRAQPGENGWIRVSLTRLIFPAVCCDCRGAADSYQQFHGHRSLFSGDFSTEGAVIVQAPVCGTCQARNRRHYWRRVLVIIPLTIVALTVIGLVVGVVLDLCGATPAPGAMTAILASLGLIIGMAISWFVADHYARVAASPLSLKDYRPSDGTVQVRFRNRQYADAFLV